MLDDIDIIDWYENVSANNSKYSNFYPNPFFSQTTIETANILEDATLTVYNLFGQQVKQVNKISGQTFSFFRENLISGFYFFRLTENNNIIATGKMEITDRK